MLAILAILLTLPFVAKASAEQPPNLIHLEPGDAENLAQPSSVSPDPSRMQNINAATETVEDGAICTTIDFEGLGNIAPVPEFDGITSPGWLSIIDFDAGGTGNIAFEPSPSTVAFWLGGAPGARDILITEPASKLGFFYTSFVSVSLQAFDAAGNLVDSASGPPNFNQGPGGDPNGTFNKWDPLEVESPESDIVRVRVTGNVNQTAIDDLKVCRRLAIENIEITQAIQEIQEIDDLEADLAADREPPVPLIEDKPAVMRVYPQQVQTAITVKVELEISGVINQTRSLRLQPHCDPDLRRRRERGCRSIDFYFTPPGGNWTANVRLLTDADEELETRELELRSRDADDLVLRSVSVCDSRDAMGNWQCESGAAVGGLIGFLGRTAPTDEVRVSATNNFVRNDISTYDADGSGAIDGREPARWFIDTVAQIGDLYGLWDRLLGLFGQERYYYGMVRNAVPGGIGGIADGIPSRGAMSRVSTVRLGVEVNDETLAHEVGHMLGRRHTNTNVPAAAGAPPGCYNLARDGATDWPFADNTLQSANGPEVGYDVAARDVKLPESHFEWMSYCTPRWATPFTYTNVMTPLGATFAATAEAVEAEFWTVGGVIEDGAATLQPIFELRVLGPTETGFGAYRVETRDAGGAVLFTRRFDPRVAHAESVEADDVVGPGVFFELLPADPAASSIVVVDPADTVLASVALAGDTPTVEIVSPSAGDLLSGGEELAWTITDGDSSEHWSAVDYSTDGGATWGRLGTVGEQTLRVDFGLVGGADSALLRVTASDGVNSGSATVGPFAVAKKLPSVEILGPADGEIFQRLDLVYLEANAYDPDDGFLDDAAVSWFSSLDGGLGDGDRLPVTSLSEGTHVIEVTATDSDGNSASDSISVRVAGDAPNLDLDVVALDQLPTTCVRATIDAQSGSAVVGLSAVEYSLDGGTSWIALDPTSLPASFIVPGQGFFHLVARTFDEAGQVDVEDDRFFIDSPCQNVDEPPVADAGDDLEVACAALEGTAVTLDGSGSFDPEGAPLTFSWTGPFPEGGGEVGGVDPTVTLPFGRSTITLVVDDGAQQSLPDTVEVVVVAELDGFGPPLAALVAEGEEPPLPPRSFNRGRTLPLKLELACGGQPLTDDEVAAPRIVSLLRDGVGVDLGSIDADAGSSNQNGLDFRSAGNRWIFNLSTADLEQGGYTIGIELPDGRTVLGAFVLD